FFGSLLSNGGGYAEGFIVHRMIANKLRKEGVA
ncbi:hypothetical protein LCGC14_1580320, partial [marine sediment metagenome]